MARSFGTGSVDGSAFNPYPHVTVGRHTYGVKSRTVFEATRSHPVKIGNFCSIASGVVVLGQSDHRTDLPSIYPFRTLFFPRLRPGGNSNVGNLDAVGRGPVVIGHDVWLGKNAIVLSGVTIGTGAVIGAGAVVAREVAPYAVVVGNPARVVRHRFAPDIVARLLDSQWWDLPDEELLALEAEFYDPNIEVFLAAVSRLKAV